MQIIHSNCLHYTMYTFRINIYIYRRNKTIHTVKSQQWLHDPPPFKFPRLKKTPSAPATFSSKHEKRRHTQQATKETTCSLSAPVFISTTSNAQPEQNNRLCCRRTQYTSTDKSTLYTYHSRIHIVIDNYSTPSWLHSRSSH